MPTIIVITAIYVVVNLLLTALAMWLQRKFVGEKKVLEVGMVGEQTAEPVPFHKGDTGGARLAPWPTPRAGSRPRPRRCRRSRTPRTRTGRS